MPSKGPEHGNVFNAVRKMVLASGLPFEPAKVNKNWPRLAYGPAPAFGQTAEREYLDIYLHTSVSAEETRAGLEAAKPKGLELVSVERVPYALPSVQNLAAAAKYRVEGDFALYAPEKTAEDFFSAARIEIVRRADSGLTLTADAKPYVRSAETLSERAVRLTVAGVDGKWIKPQTLIAAWLGLDIPVQDELFTVEGFTFIREGLFWQDSAGKLYLI